MADQQLFFDGVVEIARGGAVAPINVVLACRSGPVILGPNARLGVPGDAAFSPPQQILHDPDAKVAGRFGSAGGTYKLIAPAGVVDVQGSITAQDGGIGAYAEAVGLPSPFGLPGAGGAESRGGDGGAGGDVVICALDAIRIAGPVYAGNGGSGNGGTALAVLGQDARAQGGNGGRAGNVHLVGTGANAQVFLGGRVTAGLGGNGADSQANGGSAAGVTGRGGNAAAVAGDAGSGGTVFFTQCVATAPGIVEAQCGGRPGVAYTIGGVGAPSGAIFGAGVGGNADSKGGTFGPSGAVPVIPLPAGTANGKVLGGPIRGGRAVCTPGDGGAGGPPRLLTGPVPGAPSGSAKAQGGTGEASRRPPPPVTAAPVAPVPGPGSPGGIAVPVPGPGSP